MLNNYQLRHGLSTMIVIGLAYIVSYYFLVEQPEYLVIAAFLTCQTNRSAPLRQQLIIFALMIAVLGIVTLLQLVELKAMPYYLLVILFFICGLSRVGDKSIYHRWALCVVLLLLFFAIAVCFPITITLRQIIEQIVLGAFIGMVIGNIVFPVRTVYEFRQAILPILASLNNFAQWTMEWLWLETKNHQQSSSKNDLIQIINAMTTMYPDWIYDVGFNPGLREGFRSFLLSLEQAADLLFAIEYEVTNKLNMPLATDLASAMQTAMRGNMYLISALINYFNNRNISDDKSNYEDDVREMEKILQNHVPASIELLDVASQSFVMTAIVRHIKDLRSVLIKLIISLPRSSVTSH